jgi:hypothetical protein
MIWFACRQCGKLHGRPESAIGSLIFCDCGQGNTVPWESTAAPPESSTGPPPMPRAAGPPRLEPVPVGEERLPLPARSVRRQRGRRRDPAFCFNHGEVASEIACAACEERFCRQCVVTFQGKTLCGPCKNYLVESTVRPPRTSGLALAAVLVALVAPLLTLIVMPAFLQSATGVLVVFTAFCLLPQLIALGLGALALRKSAGNPKVGGQSLAISAMVTAVVVLLVTGVVTLSVLRPGV